jgi:hypothetical protein
MLLREKFKSEDEQLLNTFKKINELNLNKMALSSPIPDLKDEEIKQTDTLDSTAGFKLNSILSNKKSQVQSQVKLHDLLDNAMLGPRRQVL